MRSGGKLIVLIIYLIFAVYQINGAFNFIDIPQSLETLNKWIVFVGGVLLVFGGINYFRLKSMQGL